MYDPYENFESRVRLVASEMAALLIEKNRCYGNSALNPVRIFSKADTKEQLFVRLDDKLSRIARGKEFPGDDTVRDIIGYCFLVLIQLENEEKNTEQKDISQKDLFLKMNNINSGTKS